MTGTQVRFLQAIAERVATDRVVEAHLFAPRRQGPVETGVAVVAATPEADAPAGTGRVPATDAGESAAHEAGDALATHAGDAAEALVRAAPGDASPHADGAPAAAPHGDRLVVYCARYRHTIKGPDRGKWEFDCVAQADAPLVTVDAVVRGVMDRAGDAGDPERLGAEQWRAALEEPTWAALA